MANLKSKGFAGNTFSDGISIRSEHLGLNLVDRRRSLSNVSREYGWLDATGGGRRLSSPSFKLPKSAGSVLTEHGTRKLIRRTKSLKLKYDPEREGGDEYQIEKRSDVDTLFDETGSEILPAASDDNNTVDVNSLYVRQPTDVFSVSSDLRTFSRENGYSKTPPSQGRKSTPFIANQVIVTDSIQHNPNVFNTKTDTQRSSPLIQDSGLFQRGKTRSTLSDTNTVARSITLESLKSHKFEQQKANTPRKPYEVFNEPDKGERGGISPEISTAGNITPLITRRETAVQSKRLISRTSKESTSSSLPPVNFKSNLFKRVRQISTPRKIPKFVPSHASQIISENRENALDQQKIKSPNPLVASKPVTKLPVKRKITPPQPLEQKPVVQGELTFVKSDSDKRFERVASSESVRSHYDKAEKVLRVDMFGGESSKKYNSKGNQNGVSSGKKAERFEEVNLSNIKPAYRVQREQNSSDIKGERGGHKTEANREPDNRKAAAVNTRLSRVPKINPLAANISSGATKTNNTSLRVPDGCGSSHSLGETYRVPQTEVDPVSIGRQTDAHYGKTIIRPKSFETGSSGALPENKTVLNPQYISDDLKIVKKKVKETEIILQKIVKEKKQSIQRKAILNNFNKNKASNESPVKTKKKLTSLPPKRVLVNRNFVYKDILLNPDEDDDLQENIFNKKLHKANNRKTDPRADYNTQNQRPVLKQRNNGAVHAWVKPNVDIEIIHPEPVQPSLTKVSKGIVPMVKQNDMWQVQPKIHRFDGNKDKIVRQRRDKLSILPVRDINTATTALTSSTTVATWLMDNASLSTVSQFGRAKRASIDTSKQSVVSMTSDNKQKLKVRLQTRRKSQKDNLISSGVYMPIQRKTIRRKKSKRIFTQVGRVKGYESEIPILYSDDDGPPPEPRPLTDTERNRYPYYRRYEQENDNVRVNYRDPAHKKIGRNTGALVKFFRNGDPDHRGVPLTVNRSFRNLETLLVMLNDKIPTPTGVKYIFKWPEGYEVKSVTDFQNRCVYVVSSTKNLRRDVNYGESRENFWSNKKPSAGRLRRNELGLYQKPPSPKDSPIRNAPLIVTLINNLARDKREKVILNPNTQQSFEEWLIDIHNHDMPVRGLFTEKPPHAQVKSFSHLFRELRLNNNLIACGDELLPLELTKKRQAPSSNSSNESVGESRSRKKKPPKQDMGQIYETGRAMSPTSTAMSRYDGGPKYPVPGQGRPRPVDSRRTLKDSVQFEIDGTLREFIPPTYIDGEDDGAKPDKMLKCEWVYGFRGRDARHNLLVLPETGELVYYVASVVVLYDKERDSQRVYNKHNEEITVMTLHPNNYLVATGQLHGKESEHASHIRIWHGVSLSTYSVIGLGVFYNGILSIGFSQDSTGKYMVALDGSEKHVLSVWDWETERIVARTTTSTDPVHCATFYPDGSNNSILITYGARHIYFWKIFYDAARRKEAKILRDRNSGIFEVKKKEDVPKSVNCLAFLSNGDVVTGDTSGNLMLWDRDTTDAFTCKFVIPAHDSSISTLCLLKDGTLLSGAGSEIKAWDTNNNFRDVKTRQIPVEAGSVRSIVTQTDGGNDGRLYIGTTHSAILDGSMQLKFKYLVQGHSEGIAGVVPHPFEPTFVSAGYDQVVYKWSLVTHKVIWRAHVGAPCTGVAVDHRHELVAIGTAEGTFEVLNSYNGMHIASVQVGTEPIGCLAFSPDGALLAMGCNDGLISVFAIHDRGQTFRKFNMALRGHNSGVSHLDWSTDGRCIQSVAHDHELIFWDVDSMQQIKIPRMMRDVDWFTNTCNVAYSLIGPWSNLVKDELIRVVNRSTYRDLMIIGDNKGRVRLYKYPCSKEKAEFRNVRVYSSDVTAVAFTPDTRTALTCGGNDAALIQWEVVDDQ